MQAILKDEPDAGHTAVNLHQADPAWTDLLPITSLLVLQAAVHWPKAKTWESRFFVDASWKLLEPQPGTNTAYK